MSSYTKPYTYVGGTVIDVDGHTSNEQSARLYTNDQIVGSDIDTETLDVSDLGMPRYRTVNEEWDGFSKTIGGTVDLQKLTNRAYFTATAKANRQDKKGVRNWQALPNAGYEVSVDRPNAYFYITGYIKAKALENLTASVISPGQKLFDNLFALQIENIDTGISGYSDQTGDFVFGPNGTYDATKSDYDPGEEGSAASERTITFSYYGLLNGKGRRRFQLVVDPKQERGFVTVKTFVVEVFYI